MLPEDGFTLSDFHPTHKVIIIIAACRLWLLRNNKIDAGNKEWDWLTNGWPMAEVPKLRPLLEPPGGGGQIQATAGPGPGLLT